MVTTRRTRAFHHYSVGGDLTVEEIEVLGESVEEVTCRWCGNGKAVEEIERRRRRALLSRWTRSGHRHLRRIRPPTR